MEIDTSAFDEPVKSKINTSAFDAPDESKIDTSAFDTQEGDEPTIGEIGTGLAADIVLAEGLKYAGAAGGAALGSAVPVVGTAIGGAVGYVGGAIAGGVTGSLAAQGAEGRDDISWGRVVGDTLLNFIPGSKLAKGGSVGSRVLRAGGKQAAIGAVVAPTAQTVESIIEDGKIPEKEELVKMAVMGGALGGGLGGASVGLESVFGKIGGKTVDEVDDMVAKGDLTFKDFKLIDQATTPKVAPVTPKPTPVGKLSETFVINEKGNYSWGGEVKPENVSVKYRNKNKKLDEAVQDAIDFTAPRLFTDRPVEIEVIYDRTMGSQQGAFGSSSTSPDGNKVQVYINPKNAETVDDVFDTVIEELAHGWQRRNGWGRGDPNIRYGDRPEEDHAKILRDLLANEAKGLLKDKHSFSTVIENSERHFSKFVKRLDEITPNPKEAPEASATTATPKDTPEAAPAPKPTMDGLLRRELENTIQKKKAQAALEEIVEPSRFKRFKDKTLSIIAPSKVIGKEARNEALSFRRRIASAEELGGRIERRVSKAITKDPSVESMVNDFLDGGDINPKLGDLNDELIVYREKMNELQEELIQQLEADQVASLRSGDLKKVTNDIMDLKAKAENATGKKLLKLNKRIKKKQKRIEATPKLIKKIQKSKDLNNFSSREYRMFLDSDFVPDVALRAKAVDEIADRIMAKKKITNRALAVEQANKHLEDLENKSARVRKKAKGQIGGAKYEAPLKQKKDVGDAERAWLGEITDVGERMRGTLSRVARLTARKQTDRNVSNLLAKYGLAVPANRQVQGMQELSLKSGETTGQYVMPEVQAAINRIYLDGGQQRSSNPIIAGIQDLYSSAVGLSKATKVLLNPPAYAVQVYGNTMNLLGMGVNPFASASKGMRLAFAEYGGLEYVMSKAGRTERKEFLQEINDMAKYGIKGENIIESDLRDAFERGLFSKATEKPVGFFGKLYSVPDTMGRYVGWKAQQDMLRKIYPDLSPEDVKRLAADIINDTYQNYDRLSSTVKSLSRMGIMPQFASFTAEFMRNQYNQGKIIGQMLKGTFGKEYGLDLSKADLTAMRKQGAKRLASLAAVYGATAGTIAAINKDGGVSEENEEHIRELLPYYDRDKSLAMRLSEDGKQVSYANASYIAPQAVGLAALDAGMSGSPIENLASLAVNEFIGEGTFINREMMMAINNRNERGQKISSSESDLQNAVDRLKYFLVESFKPGVAREVKKLDEALDGVGDLTTMQVLKRQLGYRVNTVDLAENAKYLIMEHKDNADMSKREYTKAKKEGRMSAAQLDALYQKANESRRQSMELIMRRNANLINRGYTEAERIQVMKDAGVGSKDILATLSGKYNDIPKFQLPNSSEVYEELEGDRNAKRKAIMEIMRNDRTLGNNLLNRWKREGTKGRLSGKDQLLRNLSVAERVDYLRENPSMLAELRRKGIATDAVMKAYNLTRN